MRRLIPMLVLFASVLASCSSSEPLAIDLAQPMAPPPVSFTISGAAADDGVVCAAGQFVGYQMEDTEGNPVTFEEWAAIFDAAAEAGSVAEVVSINDYECDDGSGLLQVSQYVRLDFAGVDLDAGQGPLNEGTWTLEGTGEYEAVTGSGNIVNDDAAGMIHMVGEVEA